MQSLVRSSGRTVVVQTVQIQIARGLVRRIVPNPVHSAGRRWKVQGAEGTLVVRVAEETLVVR